MKCGFKNTQLGHSHGRDYVGMEDTCAEPDSVAPRYVWWAECLCSPQGRILDPDSQCDAIRRCSLQDVIRSWGWSPCNRISAPIRRWEGSCPLSALCLWVHGKKMSIRKLGTGLLPDTWSTGVQILHLPAPGTVRNKCCCLSHSVYDSLYSCPSWESTWQWKKVMFPNVFYIVWPLSCGEM